QPFPQHVPRAGGRAAARAGAAVQPVGGNDAGRGDASRRRDGGRPRPLGFRTEGGGAVARPRRRPLRNLSMPIPEQRNLDKARGVIRDWLAGQLPDAKGLSISPLIGPAFTGFSNETLIF